MRLLPKSPTSCSTDMPKELITLEDNKGNVVGFKIEELLKDAQGKDRGFRTETISMPKGKSVPRVGLSFLDVAGLGFDAKNLPPYVGDKKGVRLKTPEEIQEDVKLFGEVQEEPIAEK